MQPPYRAISVFHAAARAGSISRAAEELGVTPSAVSQQIEALEIHLGAALMTKAGRGIALTEAGERYFDLIANEIERIAEATGRMRGFRSVTTLNVRASPSLSSKWVLPRLMTFLDKHSEFEVRLDGTNEPTDFSKESVDIEIRHGEGNWPGLYVDGFAEEHFLPVCAPSYCAAGSLEPSDLPKHRLIQSVKSQVQWSSWFVTAGVSVPDRLHRVLFDRSHMAIDAAVSGIGIALESNLLMWRELKEGTLICPVRRAPAVVKVTQWIVCPRDHLRHRKVRAFLEWLRMQRDLWSASAVSQSENM
jgi:LysR family transcriptional regulator, glycine cleavage system transcriptional activator